MEVMPPWLGTLDMAGEEAGVEAGLDLGLAEDHSATCHRGRDQDGSLAEELVGGSLAFHGYTTCTTYHTTYTLHG